MVLTSTPSTWIENGDRLTQPEFHRRYERRPDLKKAELIEGVVYLPSPVRATAHGDLHAQMTAWLGAFASTARDARVSDNATVILDTDNEVQPDLSLRRVDGGTSRLEDDYIVGPPELIIEIAASSAAIDLHDKKNAYRRNGVQEYIVWRVFDEAIDWWHLVDGEYRPLPTRDDGVVESNIFPGLRLHVPAMLRGDMATVLDCRRG